MSPFKEPQSKLFIQILLAAYLRTGSRGVITDLRSRVDCQSCSPALEGWGHRLCSQIHYDGWELGPTPKTNIMSQAKKIRGNRSASTAM